MLILKDDIQKTFSQRGFLSSLVIDLQSEDAIRTNEHIRQNDFAAYKNWLSNKHNAGMVFMEKNAHIREYPNQLLPDAKTLVMFIVPYACGSIVRGPKHQQNDSDISFSEGSIFKYIARYARIKDYHKQIKIELKDALNLVSHTLNIPFSHKVIVDSVPFFDRAWARESGLGFVGKNTMLIKPGLGSYFFICGVLLDCDASTLCHRVERKDPFQQLSCGSCTKCIDACPTGALQSARVLNAQKCISYLSIEHRDVVPNEFISHFSEHFYGCDVCQEVCPYNLKTLDLVTLSSFQNFHPYLSSISAVDIACMNHLQYENWFGGTAMTRAKYGGLVRNALYHLNAINYERINAILEERQKDEDPLIKKTVMQIKNIRDLA